MTIDGLAADVTSQTGPPQRSPLLTAIHRAGLDESTQLHLVGFHIIDREHSYNDPYTRERNHAALQAFANEVMQPVVHEHEEGGRIVRDRYEPDPTLMFEKALEEVRARRHGREQSPAQTPNADFGLKHGAADHEPVPSQPYYPGFPGRPDLFLVPKPKEPTEQDLPRHPASDPAGSGVPIPRQQRVSMDQTGKVFDSPNIGEPPVVETIMYDPENRRIILNFSPEDPFSRETAEVLALANQLGHGGVDLGTRQPRLNPEMWDVLVISKTVPTDATDAETASRAVSPFVFISGDAQRKSHFTTGPEMADRLRPYLRTGMERVTLVAPNAGYRESPDSASLSSEVADQLNHMPSSGFRHIEILATDREITTVGLQVGPRVEIHQVIDTVGRSMSIKAYDQRGFPLYGVGQNWISSLDTEQKIQTPAGYLSPSSYESLKNNTSLIIGSNGVVYGRRANNNSTASVAETISPESIRYPDGRGGYIERFFVEMPIQQALPSHNMPWGSLAASHYFEAGNLLYDVGLLSALIAEDLSRIKDEFGEALGKTVEIVLFDSQASTPGKDRESRRMGVERRQSSEPPLGRRLRDHLQAEVQRHVATADLSIIVSAPMDPVFSRNGIPLGPVEPPSARPENGYRILPGTLFEYFYKPETPRLLFSKTTAYDRPASAEDNASQRTRGGVNPTNFDPTPEPDVTSSESTANLPALILGSASHDRIHGRIQEEHSPQEEVNVPPAPRERPIRLGESREYPSDIPLPEYWSLREPTISPETLREISRRFPGRTAVIEVDGREAMVSVNQGFRPLLFETLGQKLPFRGPETVQRSVPNTLFDGRLTHQEMLGEIRRRFGYPETVVLVGDNLDTPNVYEETHGYTRKGDPKVRQWELHLSPARSLSEELENVDVVILEGHVDSINGRLTGKPVLDRYGEPLRDADGDIVAPTMTPVIIPFYERRIRRTWFDSSGDDLHSALQFSAAREIEVGVGIKSRTIAYDFRSKIPTSNQELLVELHSQLEHCEIRHLEGVPFIVAFDVVDNEIYINGVRRGPGEIEELFMGYPALRAAVDAHRPLLFAGPSLAYDTALEIGQDLDCTVGFMTDSLTRMQTQRGEVLAVRPIMVDAHGGPWRNEHGQYLYGAPTPLNVIDVGILGEDPNLLSDFIGVTGMGMMYRQLPFFWIAPDRDFFGRARQTRRRSKYPKKDVRRDDT